MNKEGLNMNQLCPIQQNHKRNMENITQPKQREKQWNYKNQ